MNSINENSDQPLSAKNADQSIALSANAINAIDVIVHNEKKYFRVYGPLLLSFAIYGTVIVLLAIEHRFVYLSEGVIIPLLFLTALLSNQLKQFINDWVIYLSTLILFNAIRGFTYSIIQHEQFNIHQNYVITLEKFFFFNRIAPVVIQPYFYRNQMITATDKLLAIVYGTHFVVFVLLGLVIWFSRRAEFWRYKMAFILLSVIGLSCFLLLPTMPPWMASQHQLIPPVFPLTADIYNLSMPHLFVKFNSNPVASMPSLHAGFATLCTLIVLKHYHKIGVMVFGTYSAALFLSCLVLGAHYLIDLIAGVLLAGFVYGVVYHGYWEQTMGLSVSKTGLTTTLSAKTLLIKIVLSLIILSIAFMIAKLSHDLLLPLNYRL